ncbi:MAG: hypothetical protein AB1894_29790, partial [Chloroflexota bacterium]
LHHFQQKREIVDPFSGNVHLRGHPLSLSGNSLFSQIFQRMDSDNAGIIHITPFEGSDWLVSQRSNIGLDMGQIIIYNPETRELVTYTYYLGHNASRNSKKPEDHPFESLSKFTSDSQKLRSIAIALGNALSLTKIAVISSGDNQRSVLSNYLEPYVIAGVVNPDGTIRSWAEFADQVVE